MIRPQGSLLRPQLDPSTSTKALAARTENWHFLGMPKAAASLKGPRHAHVLFTQFDYP